MTKPTTKPVPLSWHTEKRKVGDLIPYEKNPRRLTEEQKKHLTRSLEKFNLVEIPAVNTDGVIIAGHQRLSILTALGRKAEEIDVRVPNRPLSEEELKEYNLRSNKNTGEWDIDVLMANFDLDMLNDVGFSSADLGIIDPGEIDPPELEAGDDPSYQTMTFTLSNEQADIVKDALKAAKDAGFGKSPTNENSNGNALAHICEVFNNGKR